MRLWILYVETLKVPFTHWILTYEHHFMNAFFLAIVWQCLPSDILLNPPCNFAIFEKLFENGTFCLSLTNWIEKRENESAAFSYEKQGLLSWYTIETKKSLGVLNSESLLKMLNGVKLIKFWRLYYKTYKSTGTIYLFLMTVFNRLCVITDFIIFLLSLA